MVRSLFTAEAIYGNMDSETEKSINNRLEQWEINFTNKVQTEKAEKVRRLIDSIEIPF
jgi:hypothetical protein